MLTEEEHSLDVLAIQGPCLHLMFVKSLILKAGQVGCIEKSLTVANCGIIIMNIPFKAKLGKLLRSRETRFSHVEQ